MAMCEIAVACILSVCGCVGSQYMAMCDIAGASM